MQTLILYGTRYGATAGTATELAKILREEGFDVRVVDAKEEKVEDISTYELVLIGSGLKMGNWTKEPRRFMKKFKTELQQKKVALFVSSGGMGIARAEGDAEGIEKIRQKQLVDVAEKYELNPVSLGLFGGVWNYPAMGGIYRRLLGTFKARLDELGFKVDQDVYDVRDWDNIRQWARELVQKVKA